FTSRCTILKVMTFWCVCIWESCLDFRQSTKKLHTTDLLKLWLIGLPAFTFTAGINITLC
ncbi:hypothetical protein L9F63_028146, partial [Diploptera punctata]